MVEEKLPRKMLYTKMVGKDQEEDPNQTDRPNYKGNIKKEE